MAQKGKIGITIDIKIWKKLSRMKIDKAMRSFDEVLSYLIKLEKVKKGGNE